LSSRSRSMTWRLDELLDGVVYDRVEALDEEFELP